MLQLSKRRSPLSEIQRSQSLAMNPIIKIYLFSDTMTRNTPKTRWIKQIFASITSHLPFSNGRIDSKSIRRLNATSGSRKRHVQEAVNNKQESLGSTSRTEVLAAMAARVWSCVISLDQHYDSSPWIERTSLLSMFMNSFRNVVNTFLEPLQLTDYWEG